MGIQPKITVTIMPAMETILWNFRLKIEREMCPPDHKGEDWK